MSVGWEIHLQFPLAAGKEVSDPEISSRQWIDVGMSLTLKLQWLIQAKSSISWRITGHPNIHQSSGRTHTLDETSPTIQMKEVKVS